MILMLVDSHLEEMGIIEKQAAQFPEIHICRRFAHAAEALEYAAGKRISIAVLSEDCGGMDGAELGKRLREICPEMILAYACGQADYAGIAVAEAQADLIALKPCLSGGGVKRFLTNAVMLSHGQFPDVRIRTFGRFDVFVGGRTVLFHNKKAKELLALCVDHKGGRVQMEEAVDKLWPDKSYDEKTKRLYRKAVTCLHDTLREYGIPQIFASEYGKCFIYTQDIRCDYYEFLESHGKTGDFFGQYMFEYDWAEETNAWLEKKTK